MSTQLPTYSLKNLDIMFGIAENGNTPLADCTDFNYSDAEKTEPHNVAGQPFDGISPGRYMASGSATVKMGAGRTPDELPKRGDVILTAGVKTTTEGETAGLTRIFDHTKYGYIYIEKADYDHGDKDNTVKLNWRTGLKYLPPALSGGGEGGG